MDGTALNIERAIGLLASAGRSVARRESVTGGGTATAHLVQSEGGDPQILKWRIGSDETNFHVVRNTLQQLKARGGLVPAYEVFEFESGEQISLQEVLPGNWRDALSATLVTDLLAANELQSDLDVPSAPAWSEFIITTSLVGGDGWCRHESLLDNSPETMNLWQRASEMIVANADVDLPNCDAVHVDFHHRNVLQDAGRATGVFDWEGVRSGDRHFDITTLAFYSCVAGWAPRERADWLSCLVEEAGEGAMMIYVAHLAIRALDWAIRMEGEADVVDWIRWSTEALDAIAP